MNKHLLLLWLALWLPWSASAQTPADAAVQRPFVREQILVQRDFPFLSAVLDDAAMRLILAHDSALQADTAERWKSIAARNHSCGTDLHCKSQAVQFDPGQIEQIASALHRLYRQNPAVRDFVQKKLQPSAAFTLDPEQSKEAQFVDSWVRAANEMNRIIDTYCDGAAPRYADIDAMTYRSDSKSYSALITILLEALPLEEGSTTQRSEAETLFFEPALRFSIRLLQSNSRDEAGRFWPLRFGENAAALVHRASIHWDKYSYSVILVPGAGSEVANVALSPWARERLRLAVQAFRLGKAPFFLVSGGFVHPSQTPYCEALQMKRYLMEIYGIPASSIFIDPYARHTTTNLRNASREIFQYGLPSTRPMLIVSDDAQISYIQSEVFLKRNHDELGYMPVTLKARISASELEALPLLQSLYVDAGDPLDP